ncbi:hypothetical protein [Halosimplex pelagicum]|uniref:Uncharacterized protein n=1 Tax=Halosimplex pelagicum TaxID=869886 RepID=A0A7D5TB16_9EURY|nr:hypothetical protein [Halosimplex pelagicum]QLH81749.1 hypothetical protein HZS54_08965 [Halosimplex pelagicum]
MSELSRGLGAGWLDNKGSGHIAECYSGQDCAGQFGVGDGNDNTNETVVLSGSTTQVWSIMARTGGPRASSLKMYRYSIEELLTIDFEDVPSTNE